MVFWFSIERKETNNNGTMNTNNVILEQSHEVHEQHLLIAYIALFIAIVILTIKLYTMVSKYFKKRYQPTI